MVGYEYAHWAVVEKWVGYEFAQWAVVEKWLGMNTSLVGVNLRQHSLLALMALMALIEKLMWLHSSETSMDYTYFKFP